MSKKHVFIPWTGGLDSTYLIYKNLMEGNYVTSSSIILINNINQTLLECKSRRDNLPLLKNIGNDMGVNFKYVDNNNIIFKAGTTSYVLGQLPIISLCFRYMYENNDIDSLEFGYVKGDDFFNEEWQKDGYNFEELLVTNFNNMEKWNSRFENKVPIEFPLRNVTKEEIINSLPDNILKNIAYCESPLFDGTSLEKDFLELTLYRGGELNSEMLNKAYKWKHCSCSSCERMGSLKNYKKYFDLSEINTNFVEANERLHI